ncbi:MAG: hypothetical protein IK132_02780 [Clostridia bacterium]|nr:hypothetical protein [Clostridia bacterium]
MSILLENDLARLVLSEAGYAESLVLKGTGEECLSSAEPVPFFSVTQDRPFNNEVKLAHPNKRTTYPAKSIRMEKTEGGTRLTVGFTLAPYEAVVDVKVAPRYFAFTLADWIVPDAAYPGLAMTPPPAAEFRLIALSVPHRSRFGAWLNVSWDDRAAVCVLAADPTPRIDSEAFRDRRLLTADAVREIRLKGASAALICAPSGDFLDAMDSLERDFGLPSGAESRRSEWINASAYWTADCTPANVDEHIRYAKAGGFRMMLLYYTCLFRERGGYALNGNYDWRDEYPEKLDDARRMCDKIRAAGITPGLHFLQTHIGLDSRYCTPDADPRLHKVRRFTLSRPLTDADTEIAVEEDPTGCVTDPRCRILQFGGELIAYEAYTVERPFRFTGCVRGLRGTTPRCHPYGEVGGLLDVSEFGASSCYLDQDTSLQDEIADKIAEAYSAGFRFCYFDGSEGTNVPNEYHIPMAQYRVWRKLAPSPYYTEGAAKAHFSWHHLSGGNAFDIFPPAVFKEMIRRYPAEEAPRMREDFTRLNFGWWGFWLPYGRDDGGTQADLIEYGTSRAAAWDCPVTIQTNRSAFGRHPRMGDILEVFRRWEDVRARHLLTDEDKQALRDLGKEHILLLDADGQYILTPYEQIGTGDPRVRAYLLHRGGAPVVVFWQTDGDGVLRLPLGAPVILTREIDRDALRFDVDSADGALLLPIGDRAYLTAAADDETVRKAFAACALIGE